MAAKRANADHRQTPSGLLRLQPLVASQHLSRLIPRESGLHMLCVGSIEK